MASNFKTSGTDIDDVLLQRQYTNLDFVDIVLPSGLWAWGYNITQLGLSDTVHRSSPTQVGSLSDWKTVYIDRAGFSSLAIKTDGSLWAWGQNTSGQLGLGDTDPRSSPVQIGTSTDWASINLGSQACHGIKANGSLWAWGSHTSGGILGLGDYAASAYNRSVPFQVGSLTNWKQVVGSFHRLAVKTDGTLWAWGQNGFSQLGIANTSSIYSSPIQVGSLTTWKKVAAGDYHSLAIKTDGTLWGWGQNNYGEAGNYNSGLNVIIPVQIGGDNDWVSISGGSYCSAAIKSNGTLWTWGINSRGELGLGDRTPRSSPSQVGSLTNWKQVTCGQYTTFAVKTDGTLWAWGHNDYNQLGLSDSIHRSSPVQVGSLTNWRAASGGQRATVATQYII